MTFAERLDEVRQRIDAACHRCGRNAAEISLLPVTKKRGPDEVAAAAEAGIAILGENRVQEARQKIPLCPGHLEWHMIGHLQRNKVKTAVDLFTMIHSIDSARLLRAVDAACGERGKTMPVCLQVNVSGERSKYGMVPEEVPPILAESEALMHVDVVGLMTIPPFTEDPEGARPVFRRLRDLRDQWSETTGFPLEDLSMGMSHDFEMAVEEGATWIRLGSILFGPRGKTVQAPPSPRGTG